MRRDGGSGLDPQAPAVPGVRRDARLERRGLAERIPGSFTPLPVANLDDGAEASRVEAEASQ